MWRNSVGGTKVVVGVLAAALGASGCSDNILTELSSKTDNKVLLYEVQKQISEKNYDAAVTQCLALPPPYLAEDEPSFYCASAYAGRGGLELTKMVEDLSNYAAPANLLIYLMGRNNGRTAAQISDLVSARNLLRNIGGASARTGDQNALMTLIGLHTLGSVGNVYADTNDNGAVDGGYSSCSAVSLPALGADANLNALWEIKESAGSSSIPGGSTIATAITTACTALNGVSATLNFCAVTDPTTFTVNHGRGARSLIREDAVDFGLADGCVGNPVTSCICP
jgi:hypothetical protein